jgi:putative heme transporter
MPIRRTPWRYVTCALLLVAMVVLFGHNWIRLHAALQLVQHATLRWLALALIAIVGGFFCAGQIYGYVLTTLGYRAQALWLSANALVTILISQTIPAGSLGSYAFLTASLRRRGTPAASVALLASLELLSWVGAMLLLFCYGLMYVLITAHSGDASRACYPSVASAVVLLSGGIFVGSRPHATLHDWALRIKRVLDRIFGPIWPDALVVRMVDEIDTNRRLIMERPSRVLLLICLQLTIFMLHSTALLAVLWSLGVAIAPPALLAAYGLALIVSTFTVLPGGGGTVEAALTLSLNAQGVPLAAAFGATMLFRLFSFWLLLPVGALCYRMLMRSSGS